MCRRIVLFLSLFPLLLGSVAHANDDCIAAARGDPFQFKKCRAEQGDAFEQEVLGLDYENGIGVPQDYAEAFRWYCKAAEQGFSPAQLDLGRMYHKGIGVTQNHAEAAKWYLKAAEQGNVIGQSEMGSRYFIGLGVPQDYVQAHLWFNLAATHSDDENLDYPSIAKDHHRAGSGQTNTLKFLTFIEIRPPLLSLEPTFCRRKMRFKTFG